MRNDDTSFSRRSYPPFHLALAFFLSLSLFLLSLALPSALLTIIAADPVICCLGLALTSSGSFQQQCCMASSASAGNVAFIV